MTDEQDKNQKLEDLRGEVKNLHPVLESLFNAMEEVVSVEYTHGSSEQGADFILERKDNLLNETEYVAVIVKIGAIGSQDVEVINRQIRESKIPKNFQGGRKKIIPSAFWIITTGKVKPNAQELIQNEFSNYSIRIIPQHRLRLLLDRFYPAFWRNIPHEIAAKLEDIGERMLQLDRQMEIVPVGGDPFYIQQKIVRQPLPYEKQDTWRTERKSIEFIDACRKHKVILVEGEYGLGKSKLVRETVISFCKINSSEEQVVIPHYCTFWKYVEDFNSDPQLLIEENGFADDLFGTELQHCLFLDSLDESRNSAEKQLEAVEAVLAKIKLRDDVKIVITSRPVSTAVKSIFRSHNGELLEILPLSFNQVIKFIERICSSLTQQGKLLADLKSSPIYSDLPRSPISAILLGKLISENSDDVPSTLPELYSKYLEYAMGRWDQKKGLQTEKEYKAVSNILMNLSVYFSENSLPSISIEECKGFFLEYTTQRNRELDGNDLFRQCMERSDVLVELPFDGCIAFKHRTYCEFLYALQKRNSDGMPIGSNVLNTYWATTYYFYFGLKSDCSDLVTKLMAILPGNLSDRWSMVMNFPKYLLAASETKYEFIVPVLKKSIVEFVDLYIDSRDGLVDFPKGRLTKMQFLSLVTPFFQGMYGFRFFQTGLEDIALELEEIFPNPEKRCCAAFFIGFARLGFDDPKLIDQLIAGDTQHLPPEMQLVVSYEARDKGCRSAPVKKFLKNVTRKLMTVSDSEKKYLRTATPAQLIHRNLIR